MRASRIRFSIHAAALLFAALAAGCAGTGVPPAPLWDASLYRTVAVLPARMVVGTGAPPFTSPNTDLSNRLGDLMQQAVAAALVQKGYEVLAPLDLNERLSKEKELGELFMSLAAGFGLLPDSGNVSDAQDRGLEDATALAEGIGADLLVLVRGSGEYHSAGENIVQGVLTGVLTRGRQQYNAPRSALQADVFFVDPRRQTRLAGLRTGSMPFVDELMPLLREMGRQLRRVPARSVPSAGSPPSVPPPPP